MSICPQSTTTTSMTLSTHQLIEKPAVAFLVCLLDLVLELLVLGGSCVLSQFGSDFLLGLRLAGKVGSF